VEEIELEIIKTTLHTNTELQLIYITIGVDDFMMIKDEDWVDLRNKMKQELLDKKHVIPVKNNDR
jgi:hypothetical protein